MKKRCIAVTAMAALVLTVGSMTAAAEPEETAEISTDTQIITESESASDAETVDAEGETETDPEAAPANDVLMATAPAPGIDWTAMEFNVPEGVSIGSVDIGGMNAGQVKSQLDKYVKEVYGKKVSLDVNGKQEEIPVFEMGCSWSNEQELADTLCDLNGGSLISQYRKLKDVTVGDSKMEVKFDFDEESVNTFMTDLGEKYNMEAVNAAAVRTPSGFEVVKAEDGVVVDEESSKIAILNTLNTWDGISDDLSVEIPCEVSEPTVKDDVFEGFGSLHTTCTTQYAQPDYKRNKNVEQATANINGHWIQPGENISVIGMMAPVTVEGGFMEAPSYVDGAQVNTIGGGICQVATTLYNCFLDAEIQITYRKNHSYTVSYVDASMDATVYPADGLDLKAVNNTGHPLYIEGYVHDGYVTFELWGTEYRPANRTIRYNSVISFYGADPVINDVPSEDMKPGTVVYVNNGHREVRSQLYKEVYVDGVLTENILINSDVYKPMTGMRTYGAPTDDEGNSDYYVRDDGYVVKLEDKDNPDAVTYRLNPDGTFLDDPLATDDDDSDDDDNKDDDNKDDDKKDDSNKPTDTPSPSPEPTDTPAPSPEPTDTPAPTPEPTDTPAPLPEPTDTPAPAPDANQPTP